MSDYRQSRERKPAGLHLYPCRYCGTPVPDGQFHFCARAQAEMEQARGRRDGDWIEFPRPRADTEPPPRGWQCPMCSAVWAPHVERCHNCSGTPSITTSSPDVAAAKESRVK